MCITESLCCTPETNTTLQISYAPKKLSKNTQNETSVTLSSKSNSDNTKKENYQPILWIKINVKDINLLANQIQQNVKCVKYITKKSDLS